ncbi:MAG TPA: dockerin type I domain-containing protein [Pirellulales bacterium]|nr:dockerin type I domain-containing protein [Pirellulales bacterium]
MAKCIRALVGLLSIALVSRVCAAATFTPLGILSGYQGSIANDISSDGSTVVGYSSSNSGGGGGWRWTAATGLVALPNVTAGDNATPYGVSGNGSVIGGDEQSSDSLTLNGYLWSATQGPSFLSAPAGASRPSVRDVSSAGSAAAGIMSVAGNNEAFLWTSSAGITDLGKLPAAIDSRALGISADGATVVGASGTQPFLWTKAGGMVGLPSLPGATLTYGTAVTNNDTIVAGSGLFLGAPAATFLEAFRWTSKTGSVSLGFLPGASSSQVGGMSLDGSMIVGSSGTAFVWTQASGMLNLKSVLSANGATGLTGWTLLAGNGVSGDGREIAGYGLDPAGHYEAFLATLPSFATGDVNLDGIVNSQDIAFASSNWLQTGIGVTGDANGDGIVNTQDLALMSSNWLKSAAASNAAAVPEPATALLALAAMMFLAWQQTWRKQITKAR